MRKWRVLHFLQDGKSIVKIKHVKIFGDEKSTVKNGESLIESDLSDADVIMEDTEEHSEDNETDSHNAGDNMDTAAAGGGGTDSESDGPTHWPASSSRSWHTTLGSGTVSVELRVKPLPVGEWPWACVDYRATWTGRAAYTVLM